VSWVFWPLAALLTAICVGLLLRPLLRRAATAPEVDGNGKGGAEAPPERADYDIGVYRDQLGEIDRDRDRGLLSATEAEAARLEVQRRLLAADRRRRPARPAGQRRRGARAAALAVTLLLPLGGLGLYLQLGAPDLPSLPLAQRGAEVERLAEMRGLTERLQRRLAQEPDDLRGWELLARSRAELGQWAEAAEAYRQAVARGGVERAGLQSALGEAVTAAADGVVTPEARAAFDTALALDPSEPRARYYRALALQQAGRQREALDAWLELAADTPADAGWRPLLRQQITAGAEALGLPLGALRIPEGPAAPAVPGPSAEDLAAAEDLSPQEREAYVRSMVEGLATRLEEQPDDLDGWLRLVQARLVLGEPEAALAALRRAEPLVETLPQDDRRRRAVAEGLRLLGEGS